jgi:hypothetical protein
MKDMMSTTIINEAMKRISEGFMYAWSDNLTKDSLRFYFQASAKFLAIHKSKDKPVALELRDYNGGFHFAMVVQFMAQAEEGADEGSWALSCTFDESDIDKNTYEVYNFIESPEAQAMFDQVSYQCGGLVWRFKQGENKEQITEGTSGQILCILFDTIADYMRLNATIDPEMAIGEMVAFRSELAGDKVYIGVTPGALLKQIVKQDDAIGVVGDTRVAAA